MTRSKPHVTIGVLALQGAFSEHIQLLRQATLVLKASRVNDSEWRFLEVRTPEELGKCDALIIPGGESTTMSLVAARSGMLEPLREYVKVLRKPTWGTCAGLILLAESANRTKKGGQELIGGLDVRVNRNHFGRQVESFQANLDLPFLRTSGGVTDEDATRPFRGVFIRAPVVEKILPHREGIQIEEASREATVVAPSRVPTDNVAKKDFEAEVEVLARLPSHATTLPDQENTAQATGGDIIAVRQGNVFGTSFHPELTGDSRIHVWWLEQIMTALDRRIQQAS
ncbi:SNO glutamine amidotransferase [Lepidopterella palustris CBS 459.81]|uniref:glutaminase n=1 Tax=Lepidopterella palustris CBS 459.81 TaxID=1314670 RepID=A0A8E2EJW8_9PEZI|nr:SNO glutamine amidotransferase [Lepidopterella palustris CBS 459.81]